MIADENWFNQLLIWSGQVTTAVMFLPVMIGLMRRRYLNTAGWTYFYYLLAIILVNLIEQCFIWATRNYTAFWLPFLKYWSIENTNFIGILGYLSSYLLLGRFFSLVIPDIVISKWVYRISMLLALLAVIDYIWITGHDLPGLFTTTLHGAFTTFLPMIYLWFILKTDHHVNIYQIPFFWFSMGQIIAHLFSLLFFFFSDKIYETDFVLFVQLSVYRNLLRIVAQLLYAYGFWKAKILRFI